MVVLAYHLGDKTVKSLIVMSLLLTLSIASYAEGLTKREKINQLFTISGVDDVPNKIVEAYRQHGLKLRDRSDVTESGKLVVDKYVNNMMDMLEDELQWEKISYRWIDVFDAIYTDEEINSMWEYQNSEIGRSIHSKTVAIANELAKLKKDLLDSYRGRIKEMNSGMKEELEAAKKKDAESAN